MHDVNESKFCVTCNSPESCWNFRAMTRHFFFVCMHYVIHAAHINSGECIDLSNSRVEFLCLRERFKFNLTAATESCMIFDVQIVVFRLSIVGSYQEREKCCVQEVSVFFRIFTNACVLQQTGSVVPAFKQKFDEAVLKMRRLF